MSSVFSTALMILKRQKIKLAIGFSAIGISLVARYIFLQIVKYKNWKYWMNGIDAFTESMIKDECNKQAIQLHKESSQKYIITFPSPYQYDIVASVDLNCFPNSVISTIYQDENTYTIPAVDEYYGSLGFIDNIFYYGKYSNGILGYSFDTNMNAHSNIEWQNINDARDYFHSIIGNRLYDMQHEKTVGLWDDVNVDNLRENQILSALLGDFSDGNSSDYWITLIAFCGYGCHRTGPVNKCEEHPNAFFVNDVTFLSQYAVRTGFEMYGAAAYFDAKYHLVEIYVCHDHSERVIKLIDGYIHENAIVPLEISNLCHDYYGLSKHLYKCPNNVDGTGSSIAEWNHAKWIWKVSVSVAVFLVDMLSHSRLRESAGLTKAIRKTLGENHPMRRLLLPFTYGTGYANLVFNQFLRKNGLYHRCFAFKYEELQRLIRDSMCDAPDIRSGGTKKQIDAMKYKFRLMRKKVAIMKKLPDEIYPIYTDMWDLWVQTIKFVEEYVSVFYNDNDRDDSMLLADKELAGFYKQCLFNLGVPDKYRLKKFNIINILTHFICNATAWSNHLNTAVSFEYSINPEFTGLKIRDDGATQTNVTEYAEYCLVVLSKGWQDANLQSKDQWKQVLLDSKMDNYKTRGIFKKYFHNDLETVKQNIISRNKRRMAPFNACNPQYLSSSIKL